MASPARGTSGRTLRTALLVVLAAAGQAARADDLAAPLVDRQLGPYVRAQVLRAAGRLAQEPCALVLTDFVDPETGRPLAEKLPSPRDGVPGHVSTLVYRLGPSAGMCADERVNAYTSPGSHVIFICREQFLRRQARAEGVASNILIHESLHSLGLGENPPTPAEIDARIEARCGR